MIERQYTDAELFRCSKNARGHRFTELGDKLPNCIYCGARRKDIKRVQNKIGQQLARDYQREYQRRKRAEA